MQVQGDFCVSVCVGFKSVLVEKGLEVWRCKCEFNNLPPLTLEANGSTDRLRL